MASDYTTLRKQYLRTWRLWYIMNQRCNPEWRARHLPVHDTTYYAISDEWSRDVSGTQGFVNFYTDMGECEDPDLCYHRLNTQKPYEHGNVIIGDVYSRSHHSSNYLTTSADYARQALQRGIPKGVWYRRLRRGWSLQKALETPHIPYQKTLD